jgi:hypothetical protein
MRIAGERKISQILERRSAPTGLHVAGPRIAAEDLGHLQVDEVRGVKGLTPAEEACGDPITRRRVEQNLEEGRCVHDEHESVTLPLCPHGFGGGDARDDRRALGKAVTQLSQCGALRNAAHLLKKVIRQRKPLQGGAGFELPMELIRDMAQLDHLRHV